MIEKQIASGRFGSACEVGAALPAGTVETEEVD
ncbi:MAG: hypothetical protein ACJASX_004196 [Limisphaerales bacterium]|jgi:hypothetical protein